MQEAGASGTVSNETIVTRKVGSDVLVSPSWLANHMGDQSVRVLAVGEDAREEGAASPPGGHRSSLSVGLELQDPICRDVVSRSDFEGLMDRKGIDNDTTVVLTGGADSPNVTYAFWVFKLYGHRRVGILDRHLRGSDLHLQLGGRDSRPFPASYAARPIDLSIRAYRDEVLIQMEAGHPLLDVRSPHEYLGSLDDSESGPRAGSHRGGRIPGAINLPWLNAVDPEDGGFKSKDQLEDLYGDILRRSAGKMLICYSHDGRRSSHSWFVLRYLLGYPTVKSYDGSWSEWGNLIASPIERRSTQ